MSDEATDVRGVAIRRMRGWREPLIVIFLRDAFPGAPVTIQGLATFARLPLEQVFQEIIRFPANAAAVRSLWRGQIRDPLPSDIGLARRRLSHDGHVFTATGGGNLIYVTETPYESWGLDPDEVRAVVLTLSRGFRDFLRRASEERQRQVRLSAVAPSFQALSGELRDIRRTAEDLDNAIGIFKEYTTENVRSIACLHALRGMLGVLVQFPKGSQDASDVADLREIRLRLEALIGQAERDLVLEWPLSPALDMARQHADRLYGLIGADEFKRHLQHLTDNRDIAPSGLWVSTADSLRVAINALLGSHRANDVLDREVIPLILKLASRPFDLSGVSLPQHPELEAAVRNAPPEPQSVSALTIFAGVAGIGTQVVGNVPGPSTLAVSVVQTAAPLLFARLVSAALRAEQMRFAGTLYRFLVQAAGLSRGQAVDLILAVAEASEGRPSIVLTRMRIRWDQQFMSSPSWGAAYGILNLVVLVVALDPSSDVNTVRRLATVVSAGIGTTLGASVALQRLVPLLEQGIVSGARNALGVVGGVFVIVSGTATAVEAYEVNDRVGLGIGVATVAGGALSVAGFLCAAGLATTATIAGAPAGAVLMAAGAILGIGAGVVGLVRSITTPGTRLVFEAFLSVFSNDGQSGERSPYAMVVGQRPRLRERFDQVNAARNLWSFFSANPTKIPELFDLGFTADHIARIVDENEDFVRNELVRSHRLSSTTG